MSVTKYAVVLGLAASTLALPQPLSKRQILTSFSDTFYRQGLEKFKSTDFTSAGFQASAYTRLGEVAAHEKAHVDFLAGALGSSAVTACTYAFPLGSVAEFLGTASVLEGVGVSAYLGAARQTASKDYLEAAGSILTIESRHSAYVRDVSSNSRLSPFPAAQDVGLNPNAIFTLASAFITSCPDSNPALPVKPFPALAASPGEVKAGQTVKLKTTVVLAAGSAPAKLYAAFITPAGPKSVDLTAANDGVSYSVTVPTSGVEGQSYLVLCNCGEKVNDTTIVAGPAILEVTPP